MTSTVCWQFKVKIDKARDDKRTRSVEGILPRVLEIPQSQAREFIVEYEWLGNAGAARYCYGLKFNEELAAVVCYARPTAQA